MTLRELAKEIAQHNDRFLTGRAYLRLAHYKVHNQLDIPEEYDLEVVEWLHSKGALHASFHFTNVPGWSRRHPNGEGFNQMALQPTDMTDELLELMDRAANASEFLGMLVYDADATFGAF